MENEGGQESETQTKSTWEWSIFILVKRCKLHHGTGTKISEFLCFSVTPQITFVEQSPSKLTTPTTNTAPQSALQQIPPPHKADQNNQSQSSERIRRSPNHFGNFDYSSDSITDIHSKRKRKANGTGNRRTGPLKLIFRQWLGKFCLLTPKFVILQDPGAQHPTILTQ